jgi:hypothetical protein
MSATELSAKRAAVLQYFELSDAGQFPAALFAPDFQFYVAKFGVGRGLEAFYQMASQAGVQQIRHDPADMLLIEDGEYVAVEGLTEGVTADGTRWRGGETPAGRFASVFHFNADGLIDRMHIYVDPDFAGTHADGFKWDRGAAQQW